MSGFETLNTLDALDALDDLPRRGKINPFYPFCGSYSGCDIRNKPGRYRHFRTVCWDAKNSKVKHRKKFLRKGD